MIQEVFYKPIIAISYWMKCKIFHPFFLTYKLTSIKEMNLERSISEKWVLAGESKICDTAVALNFTWRPDNIFKCIFKTKKLHIFNSTRKQNTVNMVVLMLHYTCMKAFCDTRDRISFKVIAIVLNFFIARYKAT